MRKNVQELKQLSVYFYAQLMPVTLGGLFVCGFEEHAVDPTLLLKKKEVFEKIIKI